MYVSYTYFIGALIYIYLSSGSENNINVAFTDISRKYSILNID